MLNVGYLTSDTTASGDEMYTPLYAVAPLVKHLKNSGYKTIWCPFDQEWSAYVRTFREEGFNVIQSSLADGKDFFEYEPDEYDVIISNPPFSIKDDILRRLNELDKPYAMLMPLPALQGQKRFKYLKGSQALIFDKRINYFKDRKTKEIQKGISFASIYICKGFLPFDLKFEELKIE